MRAARSRSFPLSVTVLVDQVIIVLVRANPKPQQPAVDLGRQSPIAAPDAHGPIVSYLLQPERWMSRIFLEQRVVLVGDRAHRRRKLLVRLPECRTRKMLHISRARPLRKSRKACSASPSSLPACASRSIF